MTPQERALYLAELDRLGSDGAPLAHALASAEAIKALLAAEPEP